LQREFRRKCIYCRVSDGIKGYEGFGVDERASLREFILSALGKFLIARNELVRDLITLESRLDDRSSEDPGAFHAAIQETIDSLERVDRQIECLTGEPVTWG